MKNLTLITLTAVAVLSLLLTGEAPFLADTGWN